MTPAEILWRGLGELLAMRKARQTLAVMTIARLIRVRDVAFASAVLKKVVAAVGDAPGGCNAHAIRRAAEDLGDHGGGQYSRSTSFAKVKTRTCLRCRKPFKSEHVGNRMCPPCKALGE